VDSLRLTVFVDDDDRCDGQAVLDVELADVVAAIAVRGEPMTWSWIHGITGCVRLQIAVHHADNT